jgi:hypothetical protein
VNATYAVGATLLQPYFDVDGSKSFNQTETPIPGQEADPVLAFLAPSMSP